MDGPGGMDIGDIAKNIKKAKGADKDKDEKDQ